MARLSILHAAKFYAPTPGGMETVIADLCAGTAQDWDVRVVCASDTRRGVREIVDGVDVERVASYGVKYSVPLCPGYPLHLWRQTADCVVLHEPNPVAGLSAFLRTPGRRLIVWHHSDLLRPSWAPPTYGRVQDALYRRADCVIVSSPALAHRSPLVRRARRVAVVPFGIELARFQRDDARPVIDRGTAAGGPRVLFVGRFVYYKGVEVLIDAMAQCEGTLLLAGDGPLEPALRERVAARGLTERVQFLGRIPDADLPAVYHSADLFVLPSIAFTETFGVVQVEAMAAGLPVISTNLPTGVPWVNQDGITGLTVAPGDADALAVAIRRLSGDPLERKRLARGASARAQALFSKERMLASFRDVVEEVVRQPARMPALAGAGSL